MKLSEVIEVLEQAAPLALQERWDNSGLQVGDPESEIRRALLCTDVTEATLQEALEKGCQMVISHHPLLFHGLKRLSTATYTERCVRFAVKNDLSIYSGHTSFDNWQHGVNERFARHIGLENLHILVPQPGQSDAGLGMIGEFPTPLTELEFLQALKDRFMLQDIRHTELTGKQIRTVALCGGAGSEFVEEAIKQGADAYVSADFRHHEFYSAEGRLLIADIGHFESEQYTKEIFAELLQGKLETSMAEKDVSPIHHFG